MALNVHGQLSKGKRDRLSVVRNIVRRIPVYLAIFGLLFWICSHYIAKHYPKDPPMGDTSSRYEERFRFALSWPYYYKYFLLKPPDYDANSKYPVVILLHGVSRHMHGGRYILADVIRQKHPSFVIVPIAPESMIWGAPRETRERKAAPLALDALRAVQREFSIDPSRIYVSGYSMGGTGAFAMVEEYPDVFAASLVLCGTWDAARADRFPANVPVLLMRGSLDKSGQAEAMITALQAQGKPATYVEYPGVGHNVWDYAYRDPSVWDWLYANKKK